MIKHILAVVSIVFLCGEISAQKAIQLDQLIEAPGANYFPLTEDGTIWPTPGIQVYAKFKDHHFVDSLFTKVDSLCISLQGDSIAPLCVYIPQIIGSYYWVVQFDTFAPDTIYANRTLPILAGTNITIDSSASGYTINSTAVSNDSCLQRLVKLGDQTFGITRCNSMEVLDTFDLVDSIGESLNTDLHLNLVWQNVNKDTIFYQIVDKNLIPVDTLFVAVQTSFNDMRLDSIGLIAGDSIPLFMRDSAGIYDTLYIMLNPDSVGTDSQSLVYTYAGQYDTISITRGNSIYLFDQDSQSLSILNHILSISRGNSVDLTPYLDNDTIYQTIIKTGQAVLLSDANPLDTIADLEEEGVVFWKDGEWATDSANFHYSDVGRQLVINQDNYEGFPWKLVVSGGVMVKADTFTTGQTRLRLKEGFTTDYYDFIVEDDEMAIETPGALTDDAIRIRRGTKSNTLKIDSTGVGINIGTGWLNHDFVVGGDMFLTQHYYDSFEENGDGDFSVISRVDGGTRWKTLVGANGVYVSKNVMNDSIIIAGIDSLALDSFRNSFDKRSPYHIAFFRADSFISDKTAWDTLVLKNESERWLYFNDTLNSVAIGNGSRADNYYNTSLGALAFQFQADTITESVNNSQIDTALNVIGGLSTFITYLNSLGYTIGQGVTFDVVQTGFEMPFIDTTTNQHAPTGLQTFIIYSSSQLKPYPAHNYDSTGVGSFDLTANQYITFSTAVGAMAVVDRNRQVALGDTLLEEIKIGDTIRIKADTFYVQNQVMGYDTAFGQIIPIDIGVIINNDFAHGSVIWWDTTGQQERFQEDSLMFYWSKDSARLAIGHKIPGARLHVQENTNERPLIAEFENTGPGHANIRLHPGSGESWDISGRWEDLFYIGKAGLQPLISLSGSATDAFQIDGHNLFSFENYGGGTKASHIQTFDSFGNGPIVNILGVNVNDRIKTISFDSLAAAISVAVANPEVDFFDYIGDTLYLHIAGQIDTVRTEILSSSGGDSLGISIPADRVLIGTGTKLATSFPTFTSTANNIYMPPTAHIGYADTTGGSVLFVGSSTTNGIATIQLSGGAFVNNTTLIRQSGINGNFSISTQGTGQFRNYYATGSYAIDNINGSALNLNSSRRLTLNAYTGTTFDATPTKILNVDASGNVHTTTSAELATFLGFAINTIYTGDGSLSGNRKITTGGFSTTFESSTAGAFPIFNIRSTQAAGTPYIQVSNSTNGYEFGIKAQNLNISNGTNNTFVMEPSAGSNRLYVRANGNIGIGTSTPGAQLEIQTEAGAGDVDMIKLEKDGGYGFSVIGQYYGHAVPTERGMYIQSQTSNQRWLVQEEIGRNVGFYNLNPAYTVDVGAEEGANGSLRAVGTVVLGTTEVFRGAITTTINAEGNLYIKGGIRDYIGSGGNTGQFLAYHDSDLGFGGTDDEVQWRSVGWGDLSGVPVGFSDNVDNVDDSDANPNNELQTLGINKTASSNTITLDLGGGTAAINLFGATEAGLAPATGVGPSGNRYLNDLGGWTTPAGGGGSSPWTDASTYIHPTTASRFVLVGSDLSDRATERFNVSTTSGNGAAMQAFWGTSTSTSSQFAGIYFNNTNMTNSLLRAGDILSIKTANTQGAISIGYYDSDTRRTPFYAGVAGTAIRGEVSQGVFIGNHSNVGDDLKVVNSSNVTRIGHEARLLNGTTRADISFGTASPVEIAVTIQGDGNTSFKVQDHSGGLISKQTSSLMEVFKPMKIGNGGNGLWIRNSSNDIWIGHEDATASRIRFSQTGGEVYVESEETIGGDMFIEASDVIQLRAGTHASSTGRNIQLAAGSVSNNGYVYTPDYTYMSLGATWSASGNRLEVWGNAGKSVGGASWATISDSIIKTDIQYIENPYEKVLSLKPVNYRYKKEYLENQKIDDRVYHGFIAQDYKEVFPEEVKKTKFGSIDGNEILSITPDGATIYTIAAVKQLIQDKQSLEARIDGQQQMIDELSKRLSKLEK